MFPGANACFESVANDCCAIAVSEQAIAANKPSIKPKRDILSLPGSVKRGKAHHRVGQYLVQWSIIRK